MPDSTLSRRSAALLRVDLGNSCFTRHINFPRKLQKTLQKGLGRLAARDAAVFELLMDVRNLLKPLNVLDDPSIVGRIENEVASELSLSSAAQLA